MADDLYYLFKFSFSSTDSLETCSSEILAITSCPSFSTTAHGDLISAILIKICSLVARFSISCEAFLGSSDVGGTYCEQCPSSVGCSYLLFPHFAHGGDPASFCDASLLNFGLSCPLIVWLLPLALIV